MNSPVALISDAHAPHRRSAMRRSQRSANASLSSRVNGDGKCAIAMGSALSAANGSRSAALHCLKSNLCVSNSIGAIIAKKRLVASPGAERCRRVSIQPSDDRPEYYHQNAVEDDLLNNHVPC